MAIDYIRGGNPRCPNFILGGLLLICLFLACSWWSLTSQNFELLTQVTGLEEQLKINGEEIDKCLTTKNTLEEKSRNLQAGAASARVKLEQLETKEDDLRDTMTRAQEELKEAKKKISALESSLSFKNTELESLKTLGEAKNKTLEALRTEKKTLAARLNEEEAKVSSLKQELTALRGKPSNLHKILKGDIKTNQDVQAQVEDGVAMDGNHAAAAAADENVAAEVQKVEVAAPETDKENDAAFIDRREEIMGQHASGSVNVRRAMYCLLKLSKIFGLFPLSCLDGKVQESRSASRVCLASTALITIATAVSFVYQSLNVTNFSGAVYVAADQIMFTGCVPLNAFVLWSHRKLILRICDKPVAILQNEIMRDHTIVALSTFMAVLVVVDCYAPIYIFDSNRWPPGECCNYALSHLFNFLLDNVFLVIYTVATKPLVHLCRFQALCHHHEFAVKRKLYLKAMLVLREVSHLYQTHAFFVVVNCYGQLVSSFDYAAVEIKSMNYLRVIFIMEDFFYNFIRVAITIWVSQRPITAIRSTCRDLEKWTCYVEDPHFIAEIESFSCQLLHINLELNVYGLFNLNLEVMCSIVGTVVTYTIILLQFHD